MSDSQFQIVLVEDAEADVFLVRDALESVSLDVDLRVLDDGEKALEFIEQIEGNRDLPRPNLMLLDLNLPKRSGAAVLRRLRQNTTWDSLPVVILTSSDSAHDRAAASDLRATAFFRKPSRLDEFMKLGPMIRDLLLGRGQGKAES